MVDQLLKREEQRQGEGQNRQGKDGDDGDLATIDRESESASPGKVGLLAFFNHLHSRRYRAVRLLYLVWR